MTVARRFAPILAALLLSVACGGQHYDKLTDAAEPLRARFNADAGNPRIVMLVAPT